MGETPNNGTGMLRHLLMAACSGVLGWYGNANDALLWLAIISSCVERRPALWAHAYGVAISASAAHPPEVAKVVAVALLSGMHILRHNSVY